ncbi:MAG: hypothetical protein EXR12_08935 [Rhodospirillaceae bacterium]|nr:hypothetical protein [Rhodospirillaceae bacterium]
MRLFTKTLATIATVFALLPSWAGQSSAQQSPVTAIDVLLEPDATMLKHAAAANARLLKVFPKGFALDEAHRPHMTTLQRFVRTADLDKVYDAVGKTLAGEKIADWKLRAFKYYYLPAGETGLAGIVVEPTGAWLRLQQKIIDAVAPFAVQSGSEAAFHLTPEDGAFSKGLIEYVAAFVPASTGKKFNPHVTIGVATQEYLKAMLAEPFDAFTFSPVGVSVYQLGNFGTARRKLKAWELTP